MFKDFFTKKQLINFFCAVHDKLYNLLVINVAKFIADIIYVAFGKLSPRARLNNDELAGVKLPEASFKTFFILAYYTFLILFIVDFRGWHYYIFLALVVEVGLAFLGSFFNFLWPSRLFMALFLAFLGNLKNSGTPDAAYADNLALEYLSRITFTEYSSWVASYETFSAVVDVITYYVLYFLAVYMPYYCASIIIFLPLVASLSLFSFGYLIGYVLAGRLAVAMIFAATLSSYYVWFIFPACRDTLLALYGRGVGIFVMQPAAGFEKGGNVLFFPTQKFERDLVKPLEDAAFEAIKNAESLNLWLDLGNFINTPYFRAGFEFVIDSISMVMVGTITTISFFVHLYATIYMKHDPHQVRFYGLLSLFTFFMIVLVTGGNLIMLYIGWEGVGLSSFLLIAFWYTRVQAQKAALKAILMNKIGDMFLLLAIAFISYFSKGSTNIVAAPALVVEMAGNSFFLAGFTALDVIAFSLAAAAFVKSAQIFFHTWLADAMEGPTPVSALLHAATMVTAGVYLIVRFSYVFEHCASARKLIFIFGLATIILSSCIALAQYDIKKIIAYSTCSQLGLMFLACGMSAYDCALYHFFNHAFFKCLLFLCAGAIIHQLRNEQDIRKMGGLASKMPFTFVCFIVASMSLVGIPGFSGALSKDLIIHFINFSACVSDSWLSFFIIFSLNSIIYFTMAYSFRLIYYVFLGPVSYNRAYFGAGYKDVGSQERGYAFIFTSLAIMSIFGGKLFKNYFIAGSSTSYVGVSGEVFANNFTYAYLKYDYLLHYVAYFFTAHAAFLAVYTIYFFMSMPAQLWLLPHNRPSYGLFCFFNKKCYFDDMYGVWIVLPLVKLSYIVNQGVENGFFKNIPYWLWRILLLPYYSRVNSFRFSLTESLVYSGGGLVSVIVVVQVLYYS